MLQRLAIPAAKLLRRSSHPVPGQLLVTEHFFQVPLDYARPSAGAITLFGRSATKHETPIVAPDEPPAPKPWLVFLEGGPGFGNREPQDHPLTRVAVAHGYQVLYLDHRGVGLSTPVSTEMLARLPGGGQGSPDAVDVQAGYLKLMRQDNTVRDCEAVRKLLTDGLPEHKARWSIFGQSYGGFVAISYLSLHPEGLREVFLTGGLAPVGRTPDEVYQATFQKTIERNAVYYQKYPEDVDVLRQIAGHIEKEGGQQGLPLPGGGFLTVPRLLTIGLALGFHGGIDQIHGILLQLKASLDQLGFLTRASLAPLESFTSFDTNIIYAILHEAIYCDGPGSVSNWAAHRVGQALSQFSWLARDNTATSSSAPADQPLLFAGEMIFPLHFETYPELIPLRAVAERLATASDWPALYDVEQLSRNEVPVYAAAFVHDMYVDYAFSRDTAKLIKGTKTFETNVMYHSALRAKAEEVLGALFALRDDVID
ncbi:alpha/beta-hydrolase [Trichoderma citrinoviride]|uniref:Alpha/beta-hydrolase n=1 Tax=Trichoderma citrinoviride TaxID=58853 RepID=A0A2T4B7I8_9HYPO|nr:alpha/beta-hydrolase [Trichoderma citrinoviride]PTB65296.1 alpha/beta-hydrolase [Trichoderma citrinoviride]